MRKITTGLMGVKDDGQTLVSPSGKTIGKFPFGIAWKIQRINQWLNTRGF